MSRRPPPAVLFVLLGLLGVGLALFWHEAPIPVAAIRFVVDGPAAEAVARRFLANQGVDPAGFRVAVSFETSADAQNYVERNRDLATLSRLAAGTIHVWSWRVRFFRELEQEEHVVRVLPSGAVVGYEHILPEDAPGGDLPQDRALALAADYLARERGVDVAAFGLVDRATVRRDQRTDHTFSWERQGFKIDEATDRYTVVVHGDRPDGFSQFLKVPEAWSRAQERESNRGLVLAQVGWAGVYLLVLAIGAVFLYFLPRGDLRWRFALAATGFLILTGLIATFNSLPLLLAGYPTTRSLATYLSDQLLRAAGDLGQQAIVVLLAGATGAALYRRAFPHLAPPGAVLTRAGLRSREFLTALLLAYAFAGLWFGYISLFYALGARYFGVWSPVVLPYRDVMSTFFPLAFPLTVGAGAAITEEFLFRLFAIPFLLVLWRAAQARRPALRGGWASRLGPAVAILLPAAVWGSLHASWPQQPFFIRAFELTLVGVAAGLVLARYGIWATLLTHYIGNASVVAALFFQSGRPDLTFWALIGIAWPALLALPGLLWLARGGRLYTSKELAALRTTEYGIRFRLRTPQRGLPPPTVHRPAPYEARPFNARLWLILALLSLFAAAAYAALVVPERGAGLREQLSAAEAARIAEEYLRAGGRDTAGWTVDPTFVDAGNGAAWTYLARRLGPAEAEGLLEQKVGIYLWQVRYLRSEVRNTYYVRVGPDGVVRNFEHLIEEAAPGPRLDQDAARALAEAYAAERHGVDWSRYRLVTATSNRLPNRTDHTFEWEEMGTAVGDGKFRLSMVVRGAEVARFLPYFKTPEAFDRALAGRGPAVTAFAALAGLATLAFGAALVLLGLRFARRGELVIRPAVAVGVAGVVLLLVQRANEWPATLAGYQSTYSVASYAIAQAAAAVQEGVLRFAQLFLLVAVGARLWRNGVARPKAPARPASSLLRGIGLGALAWPPLALAGAAAALLVQRAFPDELRARPVPALTLLGGYVPALGALAREGSAALLAVLAFGGAFLLLQRGLGRPYPALALAAAGAGLVGAQSVHGLGPGLVAFALHGLIAFAAARVAWRIIPSEPVAYFVAAVTPLLLGDGLFLAVQPAPYLRANGIGLLALIVVLPALLTWYSPGNAECRARCPE